MSENEWVNNQTGRILNENDLIKLADNAMLKVRPELWEELDLEKNEDLGLDVFKYTRGSEIKLWWKCNDCTEIYDMTPYHKVKVKCKCPYCRGLRVGRFNNLQYNYPEIAKQWHPTKNIQSPHEYTKSSGEKVWWKCDNDDSHEWKATIADRTSGKRGCPYCKNKKANKSNCLNTTHPEISKYLLNKSIGDKYTYGSTIKTDWLCDKCNKVTEDRTIDDTVRRGFRCPYCSDGFKFPEKVMMFLLDDVGIKFKRQKKFKWSDDRVYDFYFELNGESYIIETHGGQHYFNRTGTFGSDKSLKEEQDNDEYKYQLAIKNGIANYIIVDCRYSEVEFIKNSIQSNENMMKLISKNINWDNIFEKSLRSKLIESCDLYNTNLYTTGDVAKKLELSIQSVIKYLKEGNKLGLCKYTPNNENSKKLSSLKLSKKVVQLNLNGEYITMFDSCIEASEKTGCNKRSIAGCAKNKSKSANGYVWRYLEDFTSLEELIDSIREYSRKQEVTVVQLTLDGDFISVYKSLTEANKATGVDHSGITRACKGVHRQAGGYKWMYKEDYEKLG